MNTLAGIRGAKTIQLATGHQIRDTNLHPHDLTATQQGRYSKVLFEVVTDITYDQILDVNVMWGPATWLGPQRLYDGITVGDQLIKVLTHSTALVGAVPEPVRSAATQHVYIPQLALYPPAFGCRLVVRTTNGAPAPTVGQYYVNAHLFD